MFFNFDDETDVLMLLLVPPETETIVHYIDENVALLYKPEDKEIVGIQIEGFVSNFVNKHNSIAQAWKLSCAGIELENAWDLHLIASKTQKKVASEVIRATEKIIGPSADVFERVLEYA